MRMSTYTAPVPSTAALPYTGSILATVREKNCDDTLCRMPYRETRRGEGGESK